VQLITCIVFIRIGTKQVTFALLIPFTLSKLVMILSTEVTSHGTGNISVRRRKNVSNWLRMLVHIVALLSREIEFM